MSFSSSHFPTVSLTLLNSVFIGLSPFLDSEIARFYQSNQQWNFLVCNLQYLFNLTTNKNSLCRLQLYLLKAKQTCNCGLTTLLKSMCSSCLGWSHLLSGEVFIQESLCGHIRSPSSKTICLALGLSYQTTYYLFICTWAPCVCICLY